MLRKDCWYLNSTAKQKKNVPENFGEDFREMVSKESPQILGYKVPKSLLVLYLCRFSEVNIIASDRDLIKILLVASKKAITRNVGLETPTTKNWWLTIGKEIFLMERLTHKLRWQETQLERGENGPFTRLQMTKIIVNRNIILPRL